MCGNPAFHSCFDEDLREVPVLLFLYFFYCFTLKLTVATLNLRAAFESEGKIIFGYLTYEFTSLPYTSHTHFHAAILQNTVKIKATGYT